MGGNGHSSAKVNLSDPGPRFALANRVASLAFSRHLS